MLTEHISSWSVFKRRCERTTAVPFLRYGRTVPIENGKSTAQPFSRYGNRRANISDVLAFVLSLAADSSRRSFLKRFVIPSKA